MLLLELRKLSSSKEDSGFDPEALQSKMGRVLPVVARYLPDAGKSEAQLRSLTEVKDNKVVAALLAAFGFGAPAEVCAVLPLGPSSPASIPRMCIATCMLCFRSLHAPSRVSSCASATLCWHFLP